MNDARRVALEGVAVDDELIVVAVLVLGGALDPPVGDLVRLEDAHLLGLGVEALDAEAAGLGGGLEARDTAEPGRRLGAEDRERGGVAARERLAEGVELEGAVQDDAARLFVHGEDVDAPSRAACHGGPGTVIRARTAFPPMAASTSPSQ